MIHGKLDLDKELEVMSKFKLNAEEWYLIRCLFLAKFEGLTNYLLTYVKNCSREGITSELLQSLKDKLILDKKFKVPSKGDTFDLRSIEFHQPFLNKYFKTSNEMGRELFDAYPNYLVMDNGKHLPARNLVSKIVFKSQNDFFITYCKQIKYNKDKHDLIIKSLEWAKEKNMIRSSLVEYVISEKYNDHIESMEKDSTGEFDGKLDTLEVL